MASPRRLASGAPVLGLVPAQAERLARRIRVDPPVLPAGGQRGSAELRHRRLGRLDVVNGDVEVRLLRVRRVGPARRPVAARAQLSLEDRMTAQAVAQGMSSG